MALKLPNQKLLYFILIILLGCRKSAPVFHLPGPSNPSDNIYLTGHLDSQYQRNLKYWVKGGSWEIGQCGWYTSEASTTGIAVQGNDIFISGFMPLTFSSTAVLNYVACYWKNGTRNFLGDTSRQSYASGIALSGNDVYISGYYDGGSAVYWKNGQENVLPDKGFGAQANAISVSGSDVYVVGTIGMDSFFRKTLVGLWKNGSLNIIGDSSQGAFGTCMAIANSDIYIGGMVGYNGNVDAIYTLFRATYWKNGIAVDLSQSGEFSQISALAVSGGNVYAAGFSTANYARIALFWENGNRENLPGEAGNLDSYTTSIALVGNDVYIGGATMYQNNAGIDHVATYWKNGTANYLNNGDAINALCGPSH